MKANFPVTGMACSACSAHVEETLKRQKGVTSASVSLLLRTATIDYNESITSPETLKAALNSIGYDMITDSSESAETIQKQVSRVLKRKVFLSWICAIAVMLLSMNVINTGDEDMSRQLMFLFALVSVVFCGGQIYVNAAKKAAHLQADMDTLIALSTAVTFLFSVFNTFFPAEIWNAHGIDRQVFFDTPAMILAFVLTGRLIEDRAKESTTAAIRELMNIAPDVATLVKEGNDGTKTKSQIPVSTIRRGDLLEIKAGYRFPADGIIMSADSFMTPNTVYVDESMLTGEPLPVAKSGDDAVYAGTMVSQGTCIIAAQLTGKDTSLEKTIAVVRDAIETKTPVERLTDGFAARFVPFVLAVAVLTFVVWSIATKGENIPGAIMSAIAVMTVACPCAMGLATPAAVMRAVGSAARRHILVKDAAALETLRRMDVLVTDKTGTLTTPYPDVDFTQSSRLPFNRREKLKDGAKEMTLSLKEKGIDVYMTSGDRSDAVAYWAEKTGISHYYNNVSAADKQRLVKQLRSEGHVVGMLGDGINDVHALAEADISIAIGKGTDVAMDTSQIIIQGDDLRTVAEAVALSRKTVTLIRQNLFWALIYNIVTIPLAAGVLRIFGIQWSISPAWAALLMALSSVSVLLNSLRLR